MTLQQLHEIFTALSMIDWGFATLIAIHFAYAIYRDNAKVIRMYGILGSIAFLRFILRCLNFEVLTYTASFFTQRPEILSYCLRAGLVTSAVLNIIFVCWAACKVAAKLEQLPFFVKHSNIYEFLLPLVWFFIIAFNFLLIIVQFLMLMGLTYG